MDGVAGKIATEKHLGDKADEGDSEMASDESQNYFSKIGVLGEKRLSRMAMESIATEDVDEIRRMFNLFDADRDGQITANELRHAIRSLRQSTTEAETLDIMQSIDADGNGVIEFPEFLSLISHRLEDIKKNEQLEKVFKVFDVDGTGEINAANLQRMFAIFGQNFTDTEINEMLKQADHDNDNKVRIDDFVKMMKG